MFKDRMSYTMTLSRISCQHDAAQGKCFSGRGAKTGGGQTLTAWLYDARPRQLLKKVVRSGSPDRFEAVAKQVAAELFQGVRLDGRAAPIESTEKKNFLQSKLFWPVVGGAAGLVVVGVAVSAGVAAWEDHRQGTIEKIILLGTSR